MSILFAQSKRQRLTIFLQSFHGFVVALALVAIPILSQAVSAQTSISNINLPQSQWQQGADRIRSADGVECSRSVAPRDKWMEVGVTGGGIGGQGSDFGYPSVVANGSSYATSPTGNYSRAGSVAYAKLVISLDRQPAQIDCNDLYQTELERLKQELENVKLGQANAKPFDDAPAKSKKN